MKGLKESRVVRVKTLDELLDSGWEYDSDGTLDFGLGEDDSPGFYVVKRMFHLLGKIIVIYKDGIYWEYSDDIMEDTWTITDEMIKEDLKKQDYPEYFI